jgi:coenzyme F420-reducing hydrogenase beta subunit
MYEKQLIDAVVHVRPTTNDPEGMLFRYAVSRSLKDIRDGAKSRYYPVEMSQVLREVLETPGRYVLVGLPCFVKAVRLLMLQNPVLQERILYTVAIVCGHLKSARFAEMLAWQAGVAPNELVSIDFRKKVPGQISSDYGIEATGRRGGSLVRASESVKRLFGGNWGYGFFKLQACDYCDDVVGETADVSFGDAWLKQYLQDSDGTNIAVVRNPIIQALFNEAVAEGRIHLDRLTPDEVVESQAGGFRHRRQGLAYRLYLKDRAGLWRPRKRVQPSHKHLTAKEKRLFDLRLELAQASHGAFAAALQANDFNVFRQLLAKTTKKYDRLYRFPLWKRALLSALGRIRRVMKRPGPK